MNLVLFLCNLRLCLHQIRESLYSTISIDLPEIGHRPLQGVNFRRSISWGTIPYGTMLLFIFFTRVFYFFLVVCVLFHSLLNLHREDFYK
jgi:hypothetical protein